MLSLQTTRRLLGICLLLPVLLACRPDLELGPEPDDSDDPGLYFTDRLLEVDIEIDPAAWDVLRNQGHTFDSLLGGAAPDCYSGPLGEPSPYTWQTASVTVDGERFDEVGLRKKGLIGSQSSTRPSLKVKFDSIVADQLWQGEERLTLNNLRQDPSLMVTCLAYRVFEDAGVPAPRCNFAHVTVNGADLGVYVRVEAVKKRFLRHNFGNDTGHLFEGLLSDFRDDMINTFTYQVGDDEAAARSLLEEVARAADADDADLASELDRVINLDAFYAFWAVEILIASWDGYSGNTNNFFVYTNPADGDRLHFVPWGVDAAFGGESNWVNGYLAWRLYHHAPTRQELHDHMRIVLDKAWDEAELNALMDDWIELIEPAALPGYMPDSADARRRIREFIDDRKSDALDYLDSGQMLEFEGPRARLCDTPLGQVTGNVQSNWGSLGSTDPFSEGSGTVTYSALPNPSAVTALSGGGDGNVYVIPVALWGDGSALLWLIEMRAESIVPGAVMPIDWQNLKVWIYYQDPGAPAPGLAGFLETGSVTVTSIDPTPGGSVQLDFTGEMVLY